MLTRDAAQITPGLALGPCRLVREVGSGGMGAVWLAARADDAYRKRVAVKLIKRGMDTREILDRFRHERQILASLEHPHIARLLDGGTTPDGLPYFVMEYVDGVPLNEYCDAHRLTTERRLALGRCLTRLGHYSEAEPLLTAAYERLKAARGEQDATTQQARQNLLALYKAEGHAEKAAEILGKK